MTLSFAFLPAAFPLPPGVSAQCTSAWNTFEPCAMAGVYEKAGLHSKFYDAVNTAMRCFQGAADDAAKAACYKPMMGILEEACPDGIDALKNACGTAHSSEFGDLAFDVFEDISADLKDGEFLEYVCFLSDSGY